MPRGKDFEYFERKKKQILLNKRSKIVSYVRKDHQQKQP